jgi:hypothetical protein
VQHLVAFAQCFVRPLDRNGIPLQRAVGLLQLKDTFLQCANEGPAVRRLLARHVQRLGAVAGADNLVAVALQQGAQEVEVFLPVVHAQHSLRLHGSLSGRAASRCRSISGGWHRFLHGSSGFAVHEAPFLPTS